MHYVYVKFRYLESVDRFQQQVTVIPHTIYVGNFASKLCYYEERSTSEVTA